jgi:serine/threonine protein kinase
MWGNEFARANAVAQSFHYDRSMALSLLLANDAAADLRGWEPGLERHVALKLLAPERARDADERGRFRREARILASLAHPGIVSTLGFGETPDVCWFAMPLLPGGTLAQRLARERRLAPEEARAILAPLAEALAYAHARGIVHRDFKAENILFDRDGGPVIADFGVAILNTSDHSRSEITRGYGTPEYMPPEQFLGSVECDGRQDVYALGVLGFLLLTGRFPFEGSATQIAAAHLTRDVPSVAAHAAGLPGDLAAVIDRCLMKQPQRRWEGAAALAAALRSRTAAPNRLGRLARKLFAMR